jgi:heme/copper-type cytochrome/quinol oxidase subunit 2
MDPASMAWMVLCMLIVIGIVAVIVYFAYRYGRMAQRLDDRDTKP